MDAFEAEGLKEFATETQAKYVDAIVKHGSGRNAALALGVNKSTINRSISALRKKAAARGFSPRHDMVNSTPEGYAVKGVSTLYTYGEDGQKVSAQWVKSARDVEAQQEAMAAALDAYKEEIPRLKPLPSPKVEPSDLLNLYVITDYHLGMYAWGRETGADWDSKIAEQLLVDWFAAAIASSPSTPVGLFCQLGDFLHYDSVLAAITPSSGHHLDADTRLHEIIGIAIRVKRRVIDMLLQKHERVHCVIAEGNHDPTASAWMQHSVDALYENEPRLTVDTSPRPYYAYQHGQTALFFHHGHKRHPKNVDTVLASMFRPIYGETKHAYAHLGHLHHDVVLETNLMHVSQHRTLASPDAYAARGGWMSGRSAQVITYDKTHGWVGAVNKTPEMVKGWANAA